MMQNLETPKIRLSLKSALSRSIRCFPVLLIGLLFGCTNPESNGMAPTVPIRTESRERDPFANLGTGGIGDGSVHSVTSKMSSEAKSSISIDPNAYSTEDGQKVDKSYYTIYMHLFFRLNWLCKRVASGELPKKFPIYVKRTQKEMEDLSKMTARDGNYKLVETAVKHLKQGMEHYRNIQDMYPLINGMTSAPWRSGESAMQTFIDQRGFGIEPSKDGSSGIGSSGAIARTSYQDQQLSTPQKKALALAKQYASVYKTSPQDMMGKEWKAAVDATRSLKVNLLGNVYNGSGVITSSEVKDTKVTPKSQDETDPFGQDAEDNALGKQKQ